MYVCMYIPLYIYIYKGIYKGAAFSAPPLCSKLGTVSVVN
jgi:hypothetical protein